MSNQRRNTAAIERWSPSALGLPETPIQTAEDVRKALDGIGPRAHLLAATTQFAFIPPGYQVALRVCRFDPGGEWDQRGKSNGTWYAVDGGKLALHKSALRMLLSAAGGSVMTVRQDDRSNPHRWEYQATVRIRTIDGQWRSVCASKDLDLTDGSPVAKGMRTDRQRIQARIHGARVCEAKAVNAAIRSALGLRGSYSKDEAHLPFVFPVLLASFDMSDPEIRRMIVAAELGIAADVYGAGAPTSRADIVDVVCQDQPSDDLLLADREEERSIERGPEQREPDPVRAERQASPVSQARVAAPDKPKYGPKDCQACGKHLSANALGYSVESYGKPMCYRCSEAGK